GGDEDAGTAGRRGSASGREGGAGRPDRALRAFARPLGPGWAIRDVRQIRRADLEAGGRLDFTLLPLAVSPVVLLVHVIWMVDRPRREPIGNVVRYVIAGALAGALAIVAHALTAP